MVSSFREMIEKRLDLQKYLFIRGFLMTGDNSLDLKDFPFFGNWNKATIGYYTAYTHNLQKVSVYEAEGKHFFLFGHAYNPFTMEIDEVSILKRIAEAYGTDSYQDRVDEITGVFVYGIVDGDTITFITDPSGMQSSYYGIVNGSFYITSHTQIIGDLCNLQMNDLTKELINYKWYHRITGDYLPGDMTQFDEVKRIVPSIEYIYEDDSVSHRRFWPTKELAMANTKEEYSKVIKKAAWILKRNMELVSRKWEKPHISLTGGLTVIQLLRRPTAFMIDLKHSAMYRQKKKQLMPRQRRRLHRILGWRGFYTISRIVLKVSRTTLKSYRLLNITTDI